MARPHVTLWCQQPANSKQIHCCPGGCLPARAGVRLPLPKGGPIWIGVRQGIVLGASDITVTNGVRMPYFKLGQHTNAEWASTIKNYPAPFAEFATDQVVLTVPSTAARKVTDPEGMMVMYDALMDVYPELAVVRGVVWPTDAFTRANAPILTRVCGSRAIWTHCMTRMLWGRPHSACQWRVEIFVFAKLAATLAHPLPSHAPRHRVSDHALALSARPQPCACMHPTIPHTQYGTPKAPYNQRMVLDCDIGGGWMHSGYPGERQGERTGAHAGGVGCLPPSHALLRRRVLTSGGAPRRVGVRKH